MGVGAGERKEGWLNGRKKDGGTGEQWEGKVNKSECSFKLHAFVGLPHSEDPTVASTLEMPSA